MLLEGYDPEACIVSSFLQIKLTLSSRTLKLFSDSLLFVAEESLAATVSAACPTIASNCTILLFLISRVSLSLLISVSCWLIVLRHAFRAVFWNSSSALLMLILVDLCLVEAEGKLGCTV